MLLQQVTIELLCVFLLSQLACAVVNNGKSVASSDSSSSNSNTETATPSDLVSASSEKEANRRELPVRSISDSYGVPPSSSSYGVPFETYGPPVHNNPELPVPVYGVPEVPTKNVVYPTPPPDIPPPLPSLSSLPVAHTFGPAFKLHPPTHHKSQFHKPIFSSSFNHHLFKVPKPIYRSPTPIFVPKPQYGLPKPIYGPPKIPKPFYGVPLKLNFIPPKPVFLSTKPTQGPIKLTGAFGGPLATYGPPHSTSLLPTYGPPQAGHVFNSHEAVYGPPKEVFHNIPSSPAPAPIYGPPEPIHHGPPHPGVPAPPTPPDIKYDGWQPILGLVSHTPSNLYGVPQYNGHGLTTSVKNELPVTYASSFAHGKEGFIGNLHSTQIPSDSYGAPLNSVTGSGGIVSSSGNDHVSGGGNLFGGQDTSLSVIKSIGYEILPNNGGISKPLDTYGAPPLDSFAPDGPYPAAVTQGKDFKSFGSSDLGLISPSGIYGVPPGGKYEASLLSPPKSTAVPSETYSPPSQLNALKINPPKSPVIFREPVPPGFIESIGESVAQKDAHGIEHSQIKFQGQAYIPPPVPDITKQANKHRIISATGINPPSNLYSLPNTLSPTSFHSVSHGSNFNNNNNLGDFGLSFNNHNSGKALTSYTAPLNVVDSSYGIPPQSQAFTAGFDQNFDFEKPVFDGSLTTSYAIPQINFQSSVPLPIHDCSQYKSQPLTSYGVPSGSASTYSTSISSLNSNVAQNNYQVPSFSFVNTDVNGLQFLSNPIPIQSDLQSNSVDIQGKSLGQEYFSKDTDFQQSQEISVLNNVRNISVQGNHGSYTLQIQSANGLNEQNGDNIPHEQVLSDGLLQSILSAIEQQPETQRQVSQQQQNIHGYGDIQYEFSGPSPSYQQQENNQVSDGEAQHSIKNQIVVSPPDFESDSISKSETSTQISVSTIEQSLPLVENNEVALYFNNTKENVTNDNEQQLLLSEKDVSDNISQDVRNGQQYGSFVSFKTPHSSYVYGEIKTANETQSAIEKTH